MAQHDQPLGANGRELLAKSPRQNNLILRRVQLFALHPVGLLAVLNHMVEGVFVTAGSPKERLRELSCPPSLFPKNCFQLLSSNFNHRRLGSLTRRVVFHT